jgi:hypothetical protein
MLRVCVIRFDVTKNIKDFVKKFLELNKFLVVVCDLKPRLSLALFIVKSPSRGGRSASQQKPSVGTFTGSQASLAVPVRVR